ncbi:hypothetical protein BCR34DRAFT_621122 [Clohesyomyces aquaticus]|uniref:HypA-like protein n=1 Tax=Clohesyomyces aquaticus TaxID=1231657 RepID=A0A1Y2AAG6_9PLEO|nr:hypothetical protein BCR34DRAFT_621122 [Clohesyomyces aquaticus]
MGSPSRVRLSPSQHPLPAFAIQGISEESADKVNRLLQENHEKYHIFFNKSGFHNHIAHHLLTLYALNASPSTLQTAYDDNASYQRPPVSLEQSVVQDMHVPERYKVYLGDEKYYHDFLIFFEKEMEEKGWHDVLNEYVFKGDERADDMLVRMFAGFLHPLIHLGFGVEFQQPAIIAEALAQAAVHDTWVGKLFKGCEKQVKENGTQNVEKETLVHILEAIREDKKLSEAAKWEDGNKIRDGILKRAPEEMIKYATQYVVSEDRLEEQTAEMINATIYYTSAAQHPPHIPKFDFYYMHCVNGSIFFSSFLNQSWLSTTNKARLLQWKVWIDLAMYASRQSPALLLDEITNYHPKAGNAAGWEDVFERARKFEDDGHLSKLVRALAHGEKFCKEYEGREGFLVKGDMWRKLGHMAIDSVEAGEPHWVRSAGFAQAWDGVPLREEARL